MMEILRDEGQKRYCCFLAVVLAAASVFAAMIWWGNGYRIKEAALCHDRSIIFYLLQHGVSESVIEEAYSQGIANAYSQENATAYSRESAESRADEKGIADKGFTGDGNTETGLARGEVMRDEIIQREAMEKEMREEAVYLLRRVGISGETEAIFMPGILTIQKGTGLQLAGLFLFLWICVMFLTVSFFSARERVCRRAARIVGQFMKGDFAEHLPRMEEGCLYRLFGSVDSLANALSAGHEEAVRAKNFLKDTISDISHQLKTPLSALVMYNEIIESEIKMQMEKEMEKEAGKEMEIEVGKEMKKEMGGKTEKETADAGSEEKLLVFTGKTAAALERMEELIQVLLKVTRLDAGAVVFEKQGWLLADVVSRAIEGLWVRAREEEKEIVLEGAEGVWINCDLQWTGEAIGNLVKNALDYTEKGGMIRVSWEKLPEVTRVSVSDNGEGIADEDFYIYLSGFTALPGEKEAGRERGLVCLWQSPWWRGRAEPCRCKAGRERGRYLRLCCRDS